MFIAAKLVFESYIPTSLRKGMWFRQQIVDIIFGNIYRYDKIFEIQKDIAPEETPEFLQQNGYPVKPRIVSITANPDDKADVLATEHQIGWWDDGPQSDDLRDIELKDINLVLSEYDGELDIEVSLSTIDGEEHLTPVLFMDKVTLCELDAYADQEEDEEDWDDMDDLTDNDEPSDDDTMNGYNREGGISFGNDSTWQGR